MCPMFESRVVLYSSQTHGQGNHGKLMFESRVVLDGSQTWVVWGCWTEGFESRVTLVQAQAEAMPRLAFS